MIDLDREALYKTMFEQAKAFFSLSQSSKDALTRNREGNSNRYRGFFPVDDGSNSFKEGFEAGWQGYEPTGSIMKPTQNRQPKPMKVLSKPG